MTTTISPLDIKIGTWRDRDGSAYRAAYVGDCVLTGPEHAALDDKDLLAVAILEARRAEITTIPTAKTYDVVCVEQDFRRVWSRHSTLALALAAARKYARKNPGTHYPFEVVGPDEKPTFIS